MRYQRIFSTLFLLVVSVTCGTAQVDPINAEGVAIDGYDVVEYFKSGQPRKGTKANLSIYNEAKYYFASTENKKLFDQNPAYYVPQFDGYCALAVSYGKKISIDPQTFKITDEKLYLFYHGNVMGKKVNSLDTWNKNEQKLLQKAHATWPDVKKRKYKPGDSL